MLNTASQEKVNNSTFSTRFTRPLYDSYCFSRLPSTIESLLTGNQPISLPADVFGNLPTSYKKVIFFFIDAFGWRFFEHYAEKYPFLKMTLEQGVISKLTSQFPSTTAAHVTAIHTGQVVGQSGVYEWNYYEPLVNDIISPLPFSYAKDTNMSDTLKLSGINPEKFFPDTTLYQKLEKQGVTSHVIQSKAYNTTTYSSVVLRGSTVHGYRTFTEALNLLTNLISMPEEKPAYYFLYFDKIDAACHAYGPYSQQFEDWIDASFQQIHQVFYKNIYNRVSDTLLILTADHGQIEVDPHTTYYLDREMPSIIHSLKTNSQGHPLVPAGSARDMFLHVKEEDIDAVIQELRQRLQQQAEVYRTRDLIQQGFFGDIEPSHQFMERVGNVVILPYKNQTVWWHEKGNFTMRFLGHHGGLTPEEMEIPLLLLAM